MSTDLITSSRIHDEIAAWVQAGRELDDIETALIAPAPVSEEGRAALWLYAWALRDGDGDRPKARRFAPSHHRPHSRPKLVGIH